MACLTVVFFLWLKPHVFGESNYVLPYPSTMPGSKFYAVHEFYDKLLKYWYFGDFGQFEYNQRQTDKYLVEAKTLFEYKQYLLALASLKKSDEYFTRIQISLDTAREHGKNIAQKKNVFHEETLKHVEDLQIMRSQIPPVFVWRAEHASSVRLDLFESIDNSIRIRERVL